MAIAGLTAKAAKLSREQRRLEAVLKHSWLLPDDVIESVRPGDEARVASLLEGPFDNPLARRDQRDVERPDVHLLRLVRDPELFPFTCKHVFNLTILPLQHVILKELWHKTFPMLIATRGAGKSFLLALYSMLRALIQQGTKVVIVGAAFRQAKVVFEYCEMIWANAPVLRDLCGGGKGRNNRDQGPRRDIDRCELIMGDSIIIALPLGDGKKIRGQRANIIICDEFASVPPDVYETVVAGFGAVSQDPVQNVQEHARRRLLRRLGRWGDDSDAAARPGRGNQAILSGTAYYSFNWFCKYWERYKAIIESRGDPEKLAALSKDGVPDPTLNWRDYTVVRVPVGLLPPKFMDEKNVARSRMMVHSSIFLMEFSACVLPGGKVITPRGPKPIEAAAAGDLVLTHRGRFRPVTRVMVRTVDEEVLRYRTLGYGTEVSVTEEHPFWCGGESWLAAADVGAELSLANLKELSGATTIEVRPRVGKVRESGGKLYPEPSRARFTEAELADIRSCGGGCSAVARRYGVRPGVIHYVRKPRRPPKNAVPARLPLDRDLGLVVGHYAAEGSCGAGGRLVSFALDGHVEATLVRYVDQLTAALQRVFGFRPKKYRNKANTVCVAVNSRLVADLMRSVCPGVSHTKSVDPEVLFSNPEFLRGFVEGYWNGDGHRAGGRLHAVAGCVNEGLLTQVRLALSHFGISAALGETERPAGLLRGKPTPPCRVHTLVMHGENARRFYSTFFGEEMPQRGRPRLRNDGERSILPVVRREWVRYSGPVYNLEVAEDHSYSLLNATVHNCFARDSDGFFRRSLLETCVARSGSGLPCVFTVALRGVAGVRHLIAIDPASESDNFAIVVLALHGDHWRVVYCWTVRKKDWQRRLKDGGSKEKDFYGFCARKIRDLMKAFPCERLVMDSQGGGFAVEEALHDEAKLLPGEEPVWQVIDADPKKKKDSDGKKGLHVLEMVNFAVASYTSEANHGLKKDLEDKALLLPHLDPALLGLAAEQDKKEGRVYDTLEDAAVEVEELKSELSTIVLTQTASGREHWDVPKVKGEAARAGRLRKDRYSALVMANMAARRLHRGGKPLEHEFAGGWAAEIAGGRHKGGGGPMYELGEGWSDGGYEPFGRVVGGGR